VSATPDLPAGSLDEAITPLFATPLVVLDWPDSDTLNADLLALVEAARRAAPSAEKSNVGGWHSPTDFILGPAPALGALRERVRAAMIALTRRFMATGDYRFKLEGWANVLGPGHYNGPHNHPNATWSGVYYLTDNPGGESVLAGKLEIFDPRPAAGMAYAADNVLQRRCLFSPRSGCMLVFPSWLQHMVHPHAGAGERQSIAFNVTVA
jgi:uncharacterized protein (TIGR02466 family)